MRASLGVTLLMTAVAVGCGGSSASSPSTGSSAGASTAGSRACSPLDAMAAQPITLAHVIGAGRHADGTVYVLDDGTPSYRAFVSQGTVLQREDVSGSGSVGGAPGAESITATIRDATAPFALQIERTGGVATRWASSAASSRASPS